MKKLIYVFTLLFAISGCQSTLDLPTDDIDVQFYPSAKLNKRYPVAKQFSLINPPKSAPENSIHIGTLEVIKEVTQCDTPEACRSPENASESTINSDAYVEHFAKRMGADTGVLVEMNKERVLQNEVKHCKRMTSNCDLDSVQFELKEICTVVAGNTVCSMKKVPSQMKSCSETCEVYDIEKIAGFQKTQRTIVALYRSRS